MSYYHYQPTVTPRDDDDSWILQTESGAGTEPLTLAEAKEHLRIATDYTGEDSIVVRKLAAARQECENIIQRTIRAGVTRQITMRMLPSVLWLPYPPLVSVEEVASKDGEGVETTIDPSEYSIVLADIGKGYLLHSGHYPLSDGSRIDGYIVRYTAGYADAEAVPDVLKEAILFSLDLLYDNDLSEGEAQNIKGTRDAILSGFDPGVYL